LLILLNISKNYYFILSLIFEYNKFIYFSNNKFFKNEYNWWTNAETIDCLTTTFSDTQNITGIDLIGYENNKILSSSIFFLKFYNFKTMQYINIFSTSKKKSISIILPIFVTYERELNEFFNIKFNNMYDTRNLLLDYNLKLPILKKSINLDYISDLKVFANFSISAYTVIEL